MHVLFFETIIHWCLLAVKEYSVGHEITDFLNPQKQKLKALKPFS